MYIKILKIFFPLLCIILSHPAKSGLLEFFKEKIILKIDGEECRVTGFYYFKNNEPDTLNLNLYYPVSSNWQLPFPHFFKVTDCYNNDIIYHRIVKNGIQFQIHIPPREFKTYCVEYHQKTPGNTMAYILTTTSYWNKPLQNANFIIEMPNNMKLRYISLPQNSMRKDDNNTIYQIDQHEFMPDSNLIIKWGTIK